MRLVRRRLGNGANPPARGDRVVMLVRNSCVHDTRVRKEAETLSEAGYDVRVLAGFENGLPVVEEVRGVLYQRIRQRPWHPTEAKRRLSDRRRRPSRRGGRGRRLLVKAGGVVRGRGFSSRLNQGARRAALAFSEHRRLALAVSFALILRRRLLRQSRRCARIVRRRRRRFLSSFRRSVLRAYSRLGPLVDPLSHSSAVEAALRGWEPDVIHAHDLSTLYAAYRYSRRHECALVYDSHELELDRNTTWTPLKRMVAVVTERLCIRAADAVVTVSESIAEKLCDRYPRIARPVILLNSPPISTRAKTASELLRSGNGITKESKLIAVVGGVGVGRGLEQLIESLRYLPEEYLIVVLGPRKRKQDKKFRAHAQSFGVSSRLHLLDPLPAMEVPAALAAADVCAIPIQNVCLSYDFSMPNKLFDAVMAGIPVAVANLREMRTFVTGHKIGAVFDETNPVSIAHTVQALIEGPPEGISGNGALSRLQEEIAWDRQAAKLLHLYERLLPRAEISRLPGREDADARLAGALSASRLS